MWKTRTTGTHFHHTSATTERSWCAREKDLHTVILGEGWWMRDRRGRSHNACLSQRTAGWSWRRSIPHRSKQKTNLTLSYSLACSVNWILLLHNWLYGCVFFIYKAEVKVLERIFRTRITLKGGSNFYWVALHTSVSNARRLQSYKEEELVAEDF